MAFNPSNFGVISPTCIIPSQTLQSGSVLGSPGLYNYQSGSETLATIAAADYFESMGNVLYAGDVIFIKGSDGSGLYQVSSASKDPLSVSIVPIYNYIGGDFALPAGEGLRFYNPAGTYYSEFVEGASSATKSYIWPLSAPAVNGYFLSCTTAGVMSWSAVSTGITWNNQTTTPVTMTVNNGYVVNNAGLVTLNVPATAAVGSVFAVVGQGAGGWLIQMNTGQIANLGSSPTSSAGSLASTNRYDSLELVCTVANTTFVVRSVVGNITVA